MKKLTAMTAALLSLGCLGAEEVAQESKAFDFLGDVKLSTSIGFDSEYVVRGVKRGQQVMTPKVELSATVFEGAKLYFGVKSSLLMDDVKIANYNKDAFVPSTEANDTTDVLKDESDAAQGYKPAQRALKPSEEKMSFSRTDLYIGMTYEINDMFSVDAGYQHYFYTNMPKSMHPGYILGAQGDMTTPVAQKSTDDKQTNGMKRDGNEIFLGVTADVLMSPSAYFFYDFGCKEFAIEGTVFYALDLAQFGMNNFAAEFGAKIGYDSAKEPFGMKDIKQNNKDKDYVYYGINADLIYSLNSNAKIKAGVAFEGNSAKKNSFINTLTSMNSKGEGHKSMVFFRTAIDCAF